MKPSFIPLLFFFFFLLIMQLLSCSTNAFELPNEIRSYSNVDSRLWVIFTKFEMEAAKRGYVIDLEKEGIIGNISEIENEHAVGVCNYNANEPNTIIIDASYWKRVNELRREKIVFHELGHCLLGRHHRDDVDEKGVCVSIMRSGAGGCLDFYNSVNRADYIDELFEQQ